MVTGRCEFLLIHWRKEKWGNLYGGIENGNSRNKKEESYLKLRNLMRRVFVRRKALGNVKTLAKIRTGTEVKVSRLD